MSSRDRLNYKKAMFNLRRERNVGHHITLEESNTLRLADERMKDELARNILDFGETEDTVPTREDSIREEVVLEQEQNVLPVNLANAPDPAVGPTRLPRTGQLTPISGDLPRSNSGASDVNSDNRPTGTNPIRAARAVYRDLLGNVAMLIGRDADPNSPNTILGALSSTSDDTSTSGTSPSPGTVPTPPAPTRAQLSIITGGTQIQRNPTEVNAAGGVMYQLTLTQAGINQGVDFNQVLNGIRSHIIRASQNSFGGRAGNINFNNLVQVAAGAGGTIIIRFPWATTQRNNLRQRITEALQNAQRGELSRLGQITLIELPGDVRGETAAGGGGTGTTPAPAPAPVPLTSLPPPAGMTGAGKLISGGIGRDEVWEVEVRLQGVSLEQGYSGPLSAEYMYSSAPRISQIILNGIIQDYGSNNDNECSINPTGTGFTLRYVPQPQAQFVGAETDQAKNYALYRSLRTAMDRAQASLQSEIAGVGLRLLLPGDRNYNTAVPQSGTVNPTTGQRVGRALAGGIQNTGQAAGEVATQVMSYLPESYNQKNSLLSTRLQQLAGILKEQASPFQTLNGPNYSPAPPVSSGNAAQEPLNYTPGSDVQMSTMPSATSRNTIQLDPIYIGPRQQTASTTTSQSSVSNPNVNRMIDRVIANARRIAPSVAALSTNSKYAANRNELQTLSQYLTGEFVTAMNAAKNAPDTASKLRAVQAVYTPPNRGTLLRNGLFALGRLAASERR